MKAKLVGLVGAFILLSGCTMLEHKCDYLPQNYCGRPDSAFTYCEGCRDAASCVGGTCGSCWRCDGHFDDS